MLPGFDFIPADEVLTLKREELMREFQEMRLVRAARQGNPGLGERFSLWLAKLMVRAGERAQSQITAQRQTYLDSAAKFTA